MKKSLLATTALAALGVATVAAPASAEGFELKVGGFMEQWFGYTDSSSVDPNQDVFGQHSDVEIHVSGKQTLDNGLTIGFLVEMEAESSGTNNADEQYMTVEGSFGKIIAGSENTAPYLMHYGAKNNGIGTEEGDSGAWAAGLVSALNTANVAGGSMHDDDNQITFISPRINGIQFGASFVPEQGNADASSPNSAARAANNKRDNGFGLAANYETSISDMSLKISAGYSDAGNDDNATSTGDHTATQGAIQLGFGGFTVSAGYGEEQKDDATRIDSNAFVTSLAYNAGPAGLSILYVRGEDDAVETKQDIVEFGANYAVGPGVTFKGSVYVWDTTVSSAKTAEGVAVAGGLVLSF